MFSEFYDRKFLFKCLVWFGITFGLMKATGGAGFAIVIPMVFYALIARKTETLLFWLLVAVCALIINPNLVSKGGGFAWMQRGLMLVLGGVMAVNVMAYPMHHAIRPFSGMIAYVLFMAFSSAQGWCPAISYLKLLLFTLIYFSYLGVANQVGINPRVSSRKIRSVMLSIAVLFVLGSVALLPFPGLTQMKGEEYLAAVAAGYDMSSLYIGMANHSQSLGPVVSCISVILFADLLFSIKKNDKLYLIMLLACPYLVYRTSSRTGMGAYLLGMMFVVYVFVNARGISHKWKSRVFSFVMFVSAAFVFAVLCLPSAQEKAKEFITKTRLSETGSVSMSQVVSTRQGLMDRALYNFHKKPLLGNGFQVNEEMKGMKIKGSSSMLSAPIEKGVWVTAVLEEGGIFGWVIFVAFLFVCITTSIKRRAYMGASCLFVLTLTNLGEFTFFSMSYTGGITWALVFVGLALDVRKMEDENAMIREQIEFEELQLAIAEGNVE